jgi:hypothetical protein
MYDTQSASCTTCVCILSRIWPDAISSTTNPTVNTRPACEEIIRSCGNRNRLPPSFLYKLRPSALGWPAIIQDERALRLPTGQRSCTRTVEQGFKCHAWPWYGQLSHAQGQSRRGKNKHRTIFRYRLRIHLDRARKVTRNVCQNSRKFQPGISVIRSTVRPATAATTTTTTTTFNATAADKFETAETAALNIINHQPTKKLTTDGSLQREQDIPCKVKPLLPRNTQLEFATGDCCFGGRLQHATAACKRMITSGHYR